MGTREPRITDVSEERMLLASTIPSSHTVINKIDEVMDSTSESLDEAEKYKYPTMISIFIQVVALVFGYLTIAILFMISSGVLIYFAYRETTQTERNLGFVNGMLFVMADMAESVQDFNKEIESGKKIVPDEIKNMISAIKNKQDDILKK